ncbi:MAG TPA: carboxypeptidase-like regulatory domain-containing protein, partial [Candidatus Nanoarchaeia archaeon]|nr:carboxypeptidase-like regulatory domain-containing protein [Candidatus Nanoarchaeia archaeon]
MMGKKRGLFLLVLVLISLALAANLALAVPGCYTYLGDDETLYCQPGVDSADAQDDCAAFSDCNFNQEFISGSSCSEFAQCRQVACNIDCQTHALGWCQQLGLNVQYLAGEEVIDFNSQCTPGCCRVTRGSFESCNYGVNEYQCNLRAFRAGVSLSQRIFDNTPGMNQRLCQNNICQAQLNLVRLYGTVADQDGNIPEAVVTLQIQGTDLTVTADQATGSYSFEQLAVGSRTIIVTAPGYNELTFTVQLASSIPELQQNVVISKISGAGLASGRIVTAEGVPIAGAVISWGDTARQQAASNDEGRFTATLPAGSYTIRVSKEGFLPSAPINFVITAGQTTAITDLILVQQQFQGITGSTKVDFTGFGNFEDTAAVRIFIDGVFRGFSQSPGGSFRIPLTVGEHVITARFKYEQLYESEPIVVDILRNSVSAIELQLAAPLGECSDPGTEKNIELFLVSAVPGKKEVELKWGRPCPEVLGYELVKRQGETKIGLKQTFPAARRLYLDQENLQWGQAYSYEITALYDRGRKSPQPAVSSITLGNKLCEGKYSSLTQRWATFCDQARKKQVLTCDDSNNLVPWADCSARDVLGESDFYCARVSNTVAECKDAGACFSPSAQPFGLYSTSTICYGTASPEPETIVNFCYYDSSPKTITNVCQSCNRIESCFNYLSQSACEINNCADTSCRWVDAAAYDRTDLVDYSLLNLPRIPAEAVTPETGAGYCVADNYDSDDQCSLCGAQAGIFENYFCTADVCTSLGRCYSNHPSQAEPLSSCSSCGKTATEANNCYSYTTELECNGGEQIQNNHGEIFASADSCGWGRCSWDGASCLKDGDADTQDDCAAYIGREYRQCIIDNTPPETTVMGESVISISNRNQTLTFAAVDEDNTLGSLHYCLVSTASPGSCQLAVPGQPYPGRNKQETIMVNIIESTDLSGRSIAGETYLVRYYSKDKYSNQESVKESFVYVDNVDPEFTFSEKIITLADLSSLEVNLEGLREPAACLFELQKKIPAGGKEQKQVGREVRQKVVSFINLDGIAYQLNVTCEDDRGNVFSKAKSYLFDLQEKIDLIYPPLNGAVAQTTIIFKASTPVGATCELIHDNQKIADFVTDQNGKAHQTAPIPGFFEKPYAAEYKIVCRELLDAAEVFEEYYNFIVDFTPPVTEIILQEGSREVRPLRYGWKEFFINKAAVSLECQAEEGFACAKTFYCLGEECDFAELSKFAEFTEAIVLEKSSRICYYSTDAAGNQVIQAVCGSVIIDGYGLALEKPAPHTYQQLTWGVSSQPVFTLQFSTRVPTTECRFDFSSDFNYESSPNHKILRPDADGKYIVKNFPQDLFSTYPANGGVKKLFVKCANSDGEIGPEKQINLEYDPTSPQIINAVAVPSRIIEGITVQLKVNTDDKTLCRYSDNSLDGGSAEYSAMEFSFPGAAERLLGLSHEDIFFINFVGSTKDYRLNVQCVNGAGDISGVKEIIFTVDYSEQGHIVSVFPAGQSFASKDVELRVETNKAASCLFRENETYVPFDFSLGTAHASQLANLKEGEYLLDVKCIIEGEERQAQSSFTIDLTPPLITEVSDGNYTCGAAQISVFVYTNESKPLTNLSYELYDAGDARKKVTGSLGSGSLSSSSSSSSSTNFGSFAGIKIMEGFSDGLNPLLISTVELLENHTYIVKATATDAAGNKGRPGESNGVMIVSRNHSACQNDGASPLIQLVEDDSACLSTSVEMHCTDRVGCSTLRYSQDATAADCSPTLPYNGRKIEFSKTGWICYYVDDVLGNNHTARKEVVFLDSDGDGLKDRCDECEKTLPGKIVNQQGCAEGDVSVSGQEQDSDKDGLPDSWEQQFNAPNCLLDYTAADSDANGLFDNREDYDEDGRNNFEERSDKTDPCQVDAKTPVKPRDDDISPINESNFMVWILLLLGILMMGSGIGYLIYYYGISLPRGPAPSRGLGGEFKAGLKSIVSGGAVRAVPSAWKQDWLRRRLERQQKTKSKQRKAFFGEFNKTPLSKLQQAVAKTAPTVSGLKKVAEAYLDRKDKIRPKLSGREQNAFDRLESLASKSKAKATNSEAEDIFSRLKKIVKKG